MAKKHARREHISVRRKREAAEKRKNKQKLTLPQWLMIGGGAAVVLAVILYFVLRAPAGALPVRDGAVVKGADNWMVANLGTDSKPYYYHTANFDIPSGYVKNTAYSIKTDPLFDEANLKAEDETAAVQSVYVSTIAGGRLADDMLQSIAGYYTDSVGPATMDVNGYTWKYLLGNNIMMQNEGDVQRAGVFYLDSADGRYCIVCTAQSAVFPAANAQDAPHDDALLKEASRVLERITLPE